MPTTAFRASETTRLAKRASLLDINDPSRFINEYILYLALSTRIMIIYCEPPNFGFERLNRANCTLFERPNPDSHMRIRSTSSANPSARTGLVFALADYFAHDLHENVPFVLLDSLGAIDADRIAAIVEYPVSTPTSSWRRCPLRTQVDKTRNTSTSRASDTAETLPVSGTDAINNSSNYVISVSAGGDIRCGDSPLTGTINN